MSFAQSGGGFGLKAVQAQEAPVQAQEVLGLGVHSGPRPKPVQPTGTCKAWGWLQGQTGYIGGQRQQTLPIRHLVSQDTHRARKAITDCPRGKFAVDWNHFRLLGQPPKPFEQLHGVASEIIGKGTLRGHSDQEPCVHQEVSQHPVTTGTHKSLHHYKVLVHREGQNIAITQTPSYPLLHCSFPCFLAPSSIFFPLGLYVRTYIW